MLNKPAKILHVISDLRRGGRERQLAILASYPDPNIEHYIFSFHKSEHTYQDEYKLNIFYPEPGKAKRFIEMWRFCKEKKINLIQTWGNSETLYALPVSKFIRVPILNGSVRHGIRKNTFSQRFRSLVLKFSKYILANSLAGLKANRIEINKEKRFVIYNGIEKKFFTCFNKEDRDKLNSEHQLPADAVIFISIANFVPYKDYITIINSLAEIRKEFLFHYNIIGKGPQQNQIKELIKELGLEKNITIHSENPDIPALLSVSDIMIHSSLGEGCSNAILEASASGLIVIASNTGGTKEIINEWSFLFNYKDRNDLVQKIKEAVQLKKEDQDVRNKIQNETKKRFSVESLIKNYNDVVSKILTTKKLID